MPLRLARITDHIFLDRFLTSAEDARAREALRLMREFLNDYRPYAALLRNFQEFDGTLQRFDDEFRANRAIRTAQRMDITMLEANRLLMNFLASARSYIDITDHRLREISNAVRARYRAWKSLMYDESVSYRILENLRNVSQHQEVPIQAYSSIRRLRDDGSYEADQRLMVDRAAFLRCEIQAPVRDEVQRWATNIPVREHTAEYFRRLGIVQMMVVRELIQRYEPHADMLDALAREIADPGQVPVYLIDQEGALGEDNLNINLVDMQLHAVAIVRGFTHAIGAMDAQELDAAVRAHPRWPG